MSALLDLVITQPELAGSASDKQIKAYAWARVSTDMQEEKGLSLPEQLREIEAYAGTNGIEIVQTFSEAASAFQKKSKRVEFERMLESARGNPEISAILVHDLSRFSRDSLEAQILLQDLTRAGIKVISVTDPDIDPESVAGTYMKHILLAKNEAYSREIAFHTKKGCRSNVQTRDPETGWCYKNGGQPIWGYRAERLIRGEVKKGRPLVKSIWVPDDRIVSGKPVSEWARYCLVELAGKGASLDELRDFCNGRGISAPRQQYWGHTTWNSLLHPHCLLQYAGYGVWNVRGKNQRYNPASEWVVVPNAHQALISEDEAKMIVEARSGSKRRCFDSGYGRSKDSPYLLSGGLFTCGRCGSNLLGMRKTASASYYICGSQPHRKGLGCGTAVYVPQCEVESEVLAGMAELLDVCSDVKGFAREVNAELRRMWETEEGHDPTIPHRLGEIDAKIANIRKAVETGMPDAQWAFSRMEELIAERESLSSQVRTIAEAPQIDARTALAYRSKADKIMETGTLTDKKQLVRSCVDQIKLAPDTLEVEINYKIPEAIGECSGSGGWI
ncbi:MAG: recombinase family protein [Armatimonadetes bacterium]|nr:recombinase family protein [Armatimonadota bacterium]